MITKILITVAVLVAVAIIFRTKPRPGTALSQSNRSQTNNTANASTNKNALYIYALASGFIVLGVGVFYYKWHQDHRVVNIRVFDGNTKVVYQAYSKDIKGNKFITIDGRNVVIGENQRIETTFD